MDAGGNVLAVEFFSVNDSPIYFGLGQELDACLTGEMAIGIIE